MRKGTLWALIVTALLVLAAGIGTGLFSFFMWALALNGFMGQERAVNASMITFGVLAVAASLICLGLSLILVYFLSAKKKWNAAGSATLSILLFTVITGGLQLLSVIISAVVADQMRTNR